jgi:hypothetical protein
MLYYKAPLQLLRGELFDPAEQHEDEDVDADEPRLAH